MIRTARMIALAAAPMIAACLVGCGSPAAHTVLPPDVYVAGYQVTGTYYTATYWKNGVATELTGESVGSRAEAIAVAQGNVYVVGFEAQGKDVATIWTNGAKTSLSDGTALATATGVAVSGSDVYVCGYQIGYDSSLNKYTIAEYWKNGVPVILDKSADDAEATGIFVSGDDVYVSGTKYVTTQIAPTTFLSLPVAMYWKNGTPVLLTNGLNFAYATSIFVDNSDVYAGGTNCVGYAPDCGQAVYWKNGAVTSLPASGNSLATSIVVDGNNVYTSGYQVDSYGQLTSESWTNGNRTVLAMGNVSEASQVAVYGNDLYIGGANGDGFAGYWKNGVFSVVTNDGMTHSQGLGIALASPQE